MRVRKLVTIIIPVAFTIIGIVAIGAKLIDTFQEDPIVGIKKEKIAPALLRTAKINRVMFKKYNPFKYNKKINAMIINETTLLVELQTNLFSTSDKEIIREKQSARKHFTKLVCRVNEFKRLASVQKTIESKFNTKLEIGAEINEVDNEHNINWSITIRPSECP
ncbi:MAG: hypothetical protein U9Q62_01180 [Campylobacterota bacterium]|nr:hypothetical protein [Campylobacterota bacterium]